jgi:hypothetical protein
MRDANISQDRDPGTRAVTQCFLGAPAPVPLVAVADLPPRNGEDVRFAEQSSTPVASPLNRRRRYNRHYDRRSDVQASLDIDASPAGAHVKGDCWPLDLQVT